MLTSNAWSFFSADRTGKYCEEKKQIREPNFSGIFFKIWIIKKLYEIDSESIELRIEIGANFFTEEDEYKHSVIRFMSCFYTPIVI